MDILVRKGKGKGHERRGSIGDLSPSTKRPRAKGKVKELKEEVKEEVKEEADIDNKEGNSGVLSNELPNLNQL